MNRSIEKTPREYVKVHRNVQDRDPDFAANAAALWAAENDRLIALATKGVGALAVDALLAGALVQASTLSKSSALLCLMAAIFVASSAIAATLTQVPRPRASISPQEVAEGGAAAEMLQAVKQNQPLGLILNNLTWASISDALRALAFTIAAVAAGIIHKMF